MSASTLGLVLTASFLAQAGRPGTATTQVVIRAVTPSATDRRIDTFSGDGWEHQVYYRPSARPKGQLVVFLPGTGGTGEGARGFCTLAAGSGFHLVSLAYPNEISISTFRASPNPDAFLKARENVIYGKAPFGKLAVDEPNSIRNRLVKLIAHLAATYPKEGWSQYRDADGEPAWSKLVLAGQSQGGGHAALLAMQHSVARVLMFGSPKDFNVHFNKPARWYGGPSATPLDRYFSLVHSADEGHGCTYSQQLDNYRALKLLPRYPVVDVDRATPPYRHSRLLTSSRPQKNPHGSVIQRPLDYAEAWAYMLQEPTEP